MKNIYLTLFIALFFNFSYGQKNNKVKFIEKGYGITSSRIVRKIESKNSPSANRLITENAANFVEKTDSIPTQIGTQFAIAYKLKAKKMNAIPVTIVWTYPEGMTDAKGNPLKETKYAVLKYNKTSTFSNYTLEAENELVKGTWTFQIFFGDQLLYERPFYLF